MIERFPSKCLQNNEISHDKWTEFVKQTARIDAEFEDRRKSTEAISLEKLENFDPPMSCSFEIRGPGADSQSGQGFPRAKFDDLPGGNFRCAFGDQEHTVTSRRRQQVA